MTISKQGDGHYQDGINNQDFFYFKEGENLKMVLDGCSQAKYSEVGTRLFVQLFSLLPNRLDLECFEENVKKTFDNLLESFKLLYPTQEALEDFIMDNLLFTILACFETEDSFIVKMFGDGYIVTVNNQDRVSYLKYYYGRRPPYFVYKYCSLSDCDVFKDYNFKTYTFSKKDFKKVGIASDGIAPIARGDLKQNFDNMIVSELDVDYKAESLITANVYLFQDDVTISI